MKNLRKTSIISEEESIVLSDDDDDDDNDIGGVGDVVDDDDTVNNEFDAKLDESEETTARSSCGKGDKKISNDNEQVYLIEKLKNTSTFLVSKIIDLGRIPCLIRGPKLLLKLPRIKNVLQIEAERMNFFLRWYIRKNVYGILPVNLQIKWELVTDSTVLANYEHFAAETLNRNIIMTQYGLVDLRDDFDTASFMKMDPKLVSLLMLYKLAKLINIETVILKQPMDIVIKVWDFVFLPNHLCFFLFIFFLLTFNFFLCRQSSTSIELNHFKHY